MPFGGELLQTGCMRKHRKLQWGIHQREALFGYALITPMLIGYAIFVILPLAMLFWFSLTNYSLFGTARFVGLQNYMQMFVTDSTFKASAVNTLYFTVLLVPFNVVITLALALMMYRNFKGVGLFRTILFTPYVTSMVAWSIVWKYMFQTDNGVINAVLVALGRQPVNWLYSEAAAIPIAVVVTLLKGLGMNTVIFISALKDVPEMYYEASRLDGASPWKRFTKITLPMISQALFLVLILTIIGSFKIFGQIYVMSKGGPATSSYVFVYYIYTLAFRTYKFGYASAVSVVLFLIILVLTAIQWYGKKKWVYYET